ncbi:hypothetical protein Drorol1_Dr00007814 [Drosera rotundifolia]
MKFTLHVSASFKFQTYRYKHDDSPSPPTLHTPLTPLHQLSLNPSILFLTFSSYMGKKTKTTTSPPSPSSPAHSTASSSSSSDFEFVVSISPRKSASSTTSTLCPADDLFYKGLLLPLHLSPRISMVRSLLLSNTNNSSASSSTSNSARDSTDSSASNSSDDPYSNHNHHHHNNNNNHSHSLSRSDESSSSARPSSVTEEYHNSNRNDCEMTASLLQIGGGQRRSRFSLSRFSNVFKKRDPDPVGPAPASNTSSVKRAKDAIRRCVNKVRPLYEKLSHKHQPSPPEKDSRRCSVPSRSSAVSFCVKPGRRSDGEIRVAGGCSFSGNLGGPMTTTAANGSRRSSGWSCPSSTRSSPGHSGILSRTGFGGRTGPGDVSTMEELQSAIQGAIAHCKNSLMQNGTISVKPVVSQGEAAAGGG